MPWLRAALCLSFFSLAVLCIAGRPLDFQEKPGKDIRVHITYMESWDASRARRGTHASRHSEKNEENYSEVAGVIKEFRASCPEFTVTEAEETAHYFLTHASKEEGPPSPQVLGDPHQRHRRGSLQQYGAQALKFRAMGLRRHPEGSGIAGQEIELLITARGRQLRAPA